MAKKESTFTNMVLTLFLVALGASAAMGFVYELTRDGIAKAEAAKLDLAIKRVVPEFTNEPGKEFFKLTDTDGENLVFYIAKSDQDTIGYAIETYSKNAFGGMLRLLVGLRPDGTIHGVAVLEHKETPGLGTKMTEEPFQSQFPGKKYPPEVTVSVTKDRGDIDAITASTITSRAYCEAVDKAIKAFYSLNSDKGGAK
ncbi:MAG: RnfABCDGE type electron transport complex subunit G [Bacteroidales bacterium]|nr:RnfABCDGE type electron transport complex subunit G [Bacteroidales bacterium]